MQVELSGEQLAVSQAFDGEHVVALHEPVT
jgi:hypothetical protein